MTTLLKDKGLEKLPSFPKFTEKDDFKKTFFKLAKYLSKVYKTDADDIDYINKMDFLDIDIEEDYILQNMESPHVNDDMYYNAKSIIGNRAKVTDFKDVLLISREGVDLFYAIVPECTATTDGATYRMRVSSSYGSCRFFSRGYVILASQLEEMVKETLPVGSKSIFEYTASSWKYYRNISYYAEAITKLISLENNRALNRKYSSNGGKTIATFRQDKKYQDEDLNRSTIFNQMGFRKVEVDTETYEGQKFDYEEFAKVEQDFKAIVDKLPHAQAQPELKFRKLGKHHAWGIYSPCLNILAVDVRHTGSFIHEYGHYLDFKHGSSVYSEQDRFEPILTAYRIKLKELAVASPGSLAKGQMEYFTTPTEVFARAFELWVKNTIVTESAVIGDSKIYNESIEYIAYNHIMDLVISYFDAIFPNSSLVNQGFAANLASCKSVKKVIFSDVEPTIGGEQLSLF